MVATLGRYLRRNPTFLASRSVDVTNNTLGQLAQWARVTRAGWAASFGAPRTGDRAASDPSLPSTRRDP
jgi:hypothetical protein